jgi:hypothetical protein
VRNTAYPSDSRSGTLVRTVDAARRLAAAPAAARAKAEPGGSRGGQSMVVSRYSLGELAAAVMPSHRANPYASAANSAISENDSW